MNNEAKKNSSNNSVMTYILSAIFIIWFIASIGAMIYVSKQENKWPLLALFGQYFLVFGLVFVINNIKNKRIYGPEFLVTIIGALCIYAGFIMPKSTPGEKESFGKMLPFVLFGLFIFMGITAITNALTSKKKPDDASVNMPPTLSDIVAGLICLIIGIAGMIIYYSIWKKAS